MISNIEKTLYTFWSQFGVPCYQVGMVPSNQALPYITYTVESVDTLSELICVAHLWTSNNAQGLSTRRTTCDAITEELKTSLPQLCGDGYLWLKLNTLSYSNNIDDTNVANARISYQIEYFLN